MNEVKKRRGGWQNAGIIATMTTCAIATTTASTTVADRSNEREMKCGRGSAITTRHVVAGSTKRETIGTAAGMIANAAGVIANGIRLSAPGIAHATRLAT